MTHQETYLMPGQPYRWGDIQKGVRMPRCKCCGLGALDSTSDWTWCPECGAGQENPVPRSNR